MPDNDPKWAAQKRCDNNRKDVKAERRKITNWVKDAEKELKTGLPISGRRKGRELKLQRRIAEQARQHPVEFPVRFPSLFYLDHKNLTVPKRRL